MKNKILPKWLGWAFGAIVVVIAILILLNQKAEINEQQCLDRYTQRGEWWSTCSYDKNTLEVYGNQAVIDDAMWGSGFEYSSCPENMRFPNTINEFRTDLTKPLMDINNRAVISDRCSSGYKIVCEQFSPEIKRNKNTNMYFVSVPMICSPISV